MPLTEIHLELYRLERARWSRAGFSAGSDGTPEANGLRLRLGRVLIASGRALAGNLPAERQVAHSRPVSATR
jgi:hypothetical protein